MHLTTVIPLSGLAALGLVDVFLWIQVVRTSAQTRRRFLRIALVVLFFFLTIGLAVWNRLQG